jgi:hypothetical protein
LAWVSSHDLNTSSCRKEKLDIVPLCRWGNICQGSITKLWLEQSGFSDSWCSLEPNWAEDTSPWDIEPILFSRPWASADLGRSKCHEPSSPWLASLLTLLWPPFLFPVSLCPVRGPPHIVSYSRAACVSQSLPLLSDWHVEGTWTLSMYS